MTEHVSSGCDKPESGGDTRISIVDCVEDHARLPPWRAGVRYEVKADARPCVVRFGGHVLRVERGWSLSIACLNVGPDDQEVYDVTLRHQVRA